MRAALLLPFLALAACSEASPPPKEAEAPAAEQISAGQWEMASEVTKVTARDKGASQLKLPQGSKGSVSACVPDADVKQPQAALFVPEGMDCKYRDAFMRGGRLNATLACTKPGLSGDIAVVVNASYTTETMEGTAITETRLYGEGDERVETKLTGRRAGACSAAPAKS